MYSAFTAVTSIFTVTAKNLNLAVMIALQQPIVFWKIAKGLIKILEMIIEQFAGHG